MTRPSFEEIYLQVAVRLSERSTCRRLHVGCVITSTDFRYVYGTGYNGNASGLANDCDSDVPGSCGCLHGECNAIINCQAPRTAPKVVFCTNLPCKNCAKMLINLGGVERILYKDDYRIRDSVEIFKAAGIKLYSIGEFLSDIAQSAAPFNL